MKFAKCLAAVAIGLAALAPVAQAQDLSPEGVWQTTNGDVRVDVNYCGDGTQLCATLTGLEEGARSPENVALLNQMVVNGARWMAENRWKGTVNYGGETVTGSVTLVNEGQMKVSGCKGIACQSLQFVRV